MPVRWLDGTPRDEGVRDLVIAWTLRVVSFDQVMDSRYYLGWTIPVKCACKDQEVIYGDLVERIVEVAVVD